jgi:hypothetical protein
MQDLRFAVRRLARQPVSTLAALGVLALGVGATVVMADMLDRLLLRPPPFVSAPERVARIYEGGGQRAATFTSNVATIDALARATGDDVEGWAGYLSERLSLGRGTSAERVEVVSHTDAYFDVMGLHLIAGRPFTDADNQAKAKPVMIVNETMAREAWPNQPAVGQCARMISDPCVEVVGDWVPFPSARPAMPTPPACLVPLDRFPGVTSERALLIRTRTDPGDTLALLRREAQAAGGAALPYVDVWSFDDLFQPMLRPWKLGADVFVAFALLSLVIASAGIAVVTAYGVTRRTRELGVRLALGAAQRAVVMLVLRRSLTSLGAGLAIGVGLAALRRRWMASVLFGLGSYDLAIFTAATLLLLTAGAIAAWLPARRAARVDPAIALRAE